MGCGDLDLWASNNADGLTGELFDVLACGTCGLGHTSPTPSDMRTYYARYHGGRHGLTGNIAVSRRLRRLNKVLDGAGAGRMLLDVGCGDGSFLLAAQRQGWRVAGTEIEPTVATARGLPVTPDLPDGIFDAITFWHSLEHLDDPLYALKRARAVLAPAGVLMLAVPNFAGRQARRYGRHWLHLDVPRHLFHFTEASIARLLAAADLRPVRVWHSEWEYDAIGYSQSFLTSQTGTANVLFDALTGRGVRSWWQVAAGVGLTLGAIPLAASDARLSAGGTLVVAATSTADRGS